MINKQLKKLENLLPISNDNNNNNVVVDCALVVFSEWCQSEGHQRNCLESFDFLLLLFLLLLLLVIASEEEGDWVVFIVGAPPPSSSSTTVTSLLSSLLSFINRIVLHLCRCCHNQHNQPTASKMIGMWSFHSSGHRSRSAGSSNNQLQYEVLLGSLVPCPTSSFSHLLNPTAAYWWIDLFIYWTISYYSN